MELTYYINYKTFYFNNKKNRNKVSCKLQCTCIIAKYDTCIVHACKLEAIHLHAQFHYSTAILKVNDSAKDKTIQS